MKSLRQSISGFTLTELMVVVLVLGILASIALPSFRSLTQSQRVKNASFELFSSLSLARSEAIKRNSNVTITVSASGWGITAASGEVIRNQAALNGVVLTITPANTPIVYQRTGRATTAPTFQIDTSATPTANARCIKIELSGMPRATKGACP